MPANLSRPRRSLRRVALAAVGVLGLAAALAACGSDDSEGGGNAAPTESFSSPAADLSADLTYAVWDQNQVDAIKANLEGFNKEYPDIKVTVTATPWADYWTKLQTEASSNSLPDIFWMNGPNFQLYAANGKLAPITGLVDSGAIDPANYPSSLDDLYTYDGVQYGVPKDFDTIGIWVNKALFEQAGVDLPKDGWTWDDLKSTASAISDKLGSQGIYGIAAGMDGQTTYYPTIFQAGGEVISEDGKSSGYDSEATEAGLQYWTDLIASGASPSIQQLTDTPADQWFVSGKVAMYQGGSWARSEIGDSPVAGSVDAYRLPKGAVDANVIHGVSNVVAAGGKNLQAAQALQAYLASQEAQQQQGDLGAVIPAYTGTQAAFANSMPGVNLQVFLDQLDVAKPLPVSKNTAAWNALETDLLPDAFSGAKPVADVAKELASKMNDALADE
jgi:multiple sugar transport system substrate-binding protein